MKKKCLSLAIACMSFVTLFADNNITFNSEDFGAKTYGNKGLYNGDVIIFTKNNDNYKLTCSSTLKGKNDTPMGIFYYSEGGYLALYGQSKNSAQISISVEIPNNLYISSIEYKWTKAANAAAKSNGISYIGSTEATEAPEGYDDVLGDGETTTVFTSPQKVYNNTFALNFHATSVVQLQSVKIFYAEIPEPEPAEIPQSISILDSEPYQYPSTGFTAYSASYSRTMSNQWGTIVLPFDVEQDDEKPYDLYLIEDKDMAEGIINLRKVNGTLEAGTPAIIRKNANETGVTLEGKKTVVGENEVVLGIKANQIKSTSYMRGTFEGVTTNPTNDYIYFIANNKFWSSVNGETNESVYLAPYRAWIVGSSTSGARSLDINIDNEEITAIDVINSMTEGTAEYFDINGTKILEPKQGLNIVKTGKGTKKLYIK